MADRAAARRARPPCSASRSTDRRPRPAASPSSARRRRLRVAPPAAPFSGGPGAHRGEHIREPRRWVRLTGTAAAARRRAAAPRKRPRRRATRPRARPGGGTPTSRRGRGRGRGAAPAGGRAPPGGKLRPPPPPLEAASVVVDASYDAASGEVVFTMPPLGGGRCRGGARAQRRRLRALRQRRARRVRPPLAERARACNPRASGTSSSCAASSCAHRRAGRALRRGARRRRAGRYDAAAGCAVRHAGVGADADPAVADGDVIVERASAGSSSASRAATSFPRRRGRHRAAHRPASRRRRAAAGNGYVGTPALRVRFSRRAGRRGSRWRRAWRTARSSASRPLWGRRRAVRATVRVSLGRQTYPDGSGATFGDGRPRRSGCAWAGRDDVAVGGRGGLACSPGPGVWVWRCPLGRNAVCARVSVGHVCVVKQVQIFSRASILVP